MDTQELDERASLCRDEGALRMALGKRCAIYTRKSSQEGLEQSYNSLHAQRDACEAYVRSQAGERWSALPQLYDDGGYSGGDTRRPALLALLADVAAGEVDIVVVYKVDRLTRSLADFAKIVETLDAANAGFVAVTQQFSTTSSMGRLTLNVLLSFAQFEREVAGERIRDKKAGSRVRGLWVNGKRPFGYARLSDGRLQPHAFEADVVRLAYRRYLALGSLRRLVDEMTARGLVNRDGHPWSATVLARLLKNRLYRGELTHRGAAGPATHPPLVTEAQFRAVQAALRNADRKLLARRRPPVLAMLKGLAHTAGGEAMLHTFCRRNGRPYRYYLSSRHTQYGPGSSPTGRFRAQDLEHAVLAAVDGLVGSSPAEHRSEVQAAGLIRQVVARVEVGPDDMLIHLRTGACLRRSHVGRIAGERKRAMSSSPAPSILP